MNPRSQMTKCFVFILVVLGDALEGASASDFAARCAAPGVIKCVGFDDAADIEGTWGDIHGAFNNDPNGLVPTLDATVAVSGASSLKFVIPSNSGAGASGQYFTNFSDDRSILFGENSAFFIQWRQRFSPEFLDTDFRDSMGFKQEVIGTGDTAACDPDHPTSGTCPTSCTALEVVTTNQYQRGFPQMYHSCTGSTSHRPYDAFEEKYGSSDFKLQNARPAPYCLYSQGKTNPVTFFPPDGNCLAYFPDEWMTFQVEIQTGPRVGDEFVGSHVRLWVAREGLPSEPVFDWGPYNLSAGSPEEDQKYGKIWLLPYQTGKDASQSHPTAYTWYDELIISRYRIADPGVPRESVPPAAPTNLRVR